ncbi:MAG: D-alanine--D-alanine ligase A, partial [Actinomycetaceae bacterium]|nr:D-alanine--D-alanine ligase A [Actinomycetaceae bacterium]
MSKIRLALICGGMSPEHSVSLVSAASVMRAIDRERYEIIPIKITRSGTWVLAPDNPEELSSEGFAQTDQCALPEQSNEDAPASHIVLGMANRHFYEISADGNHVKDLGKIDVVFPVLH